MNLRFIPASIISHCHPTLEALSFLVTCSKIIVDAQTWLDFNFDDVGTGEIIVLVMELFSVESKGALRRLGDLD